LGAGLDVVADLAADLQLREPLALQLDRELEARLDVYGLEHLQLLLAGEVRAVADRVGQGARVIDRPEEHANPLVGPAQLEDLLDYGAVLLHELGRALVGGIAVVDLLDVDVELLAGRLSGTSQPAVEANYGGDLRPVRELPALDHLGDDADAAEVAVLA